MVKVHVCVKTCFEVEAPSIVLNHDFKGDEGLKDLHELLFGEYSDIEPEDILAVYTDEDIIYEAE